MENNDRVYCFSRPNFARTSLSVSIAAFQVERKYFMNESKNGVRFDASHVFPRHNATCGMFFLHKVELGGVFNPRREDVIHREPGTQQRRDAEQQESSEPCLPTRAPAVVARCAYAFLHTLLANFLVANEGVLNA